MTNKKAQKMSEVEPLNENLNLTLVCMKSETNSLLIKNWKTFICFVTFVGKLGESSSFLRLYAILHPETQLS